MPPKLSTANQYGKKKRKRVFHGNSKKNSNPKQVADGSNSTTPGTSQTPSTSNLPTNNSTVTPVQAAGADAVTTSSQPSTSKRKLDLYESSVPSTDPTDITKSQYRLIDSEVFQTMLDSVNPTCEECSAMDGVSVSESTIYGLSSKIQLTCNACHHVMYSGFTSKTTNVGRSHDINNRFVLACKSSGIGYEQSSAFIANLNLQAPISPTVFTEKLVKLEAACQSALREHLEYIHDIVRIKYIEAGLASEEADIVNIEVSFDGTWHKRGHTSHTGIGVAIDILTGYVVDFEVVSNFCVVCEKEKTKEDDRSLQELMDFSINHKGKCDINHAGSSNAMEVAAAKVIWERSKSGKLRYVTMLSDGDSKAYDAVRDMKPYGDDDDLQIKKEECLNHVAKRLTAALETLKKKSATLLGGKEMLTQTLIRTLSTYYREAIKKNAGNIEEMRNAILAAPYHCTSSEESPDHRYCPDNSWCWYKNPSKPKTKPDLPKPMLSRLLPIYERLSATTLLERCARVSTQNANESLNSVIWKRCSKTVWYSRSSVMMAATFGVMGFNGGEVELHRVGAKFGLSTATHQLNHASRKDAMRVRRKTVPSGQRKDRKHRQISDRQRNIQKEGVTYAAGKFDSLGSGDR